jgi:predicted ATP-grasp superfamily ATP-dependent carboligase
MTTKPGVIVIEGHVQGLSNTRALGSLGIPVYVVDTNNCIARYSRYCDKFFKCPEYKSDALADFLLDLAKGEELNGWLLLPSNDHAVSTLSRNKKRLSRFYKVISPDESILNNIYDKSKLLKVAQECNIPFPATVYFESSEINHLNLRFPLITKGKEGLNFYKATGKKAYFSDNSDQFQKVLREIADKLPINKTFTQELIPFDGDNKTISFTAFCINGEIKAHWTGVKLREHPIRFGTATFCESVDGETLKKISIPLLKKLNYTGVCEIEYLKDPRDNEFKLIEINARTWLWVGLAKACGVDYAHMIYNFVNDIPFEYPEKYYIGLKWVNYLTDTAMIFKTIKAKEFNIIQHIKSLKGKKVQAVYSGKDPVPALILLVLSIYLAKRRITI